MVNKFERTEVVIDDRSFNDATAVSITRQAGELWQMTLTLNLYAVEIQRVNSMDGSVVIATTLRAGEERAKAERDYKRVLEAEAAKRGVDLG